MAEEIPTSSTGPRERPPLRYATPLGVSDITSSMRDNLRKGFRERRREAFNTGMVDGTFNRQWLQDPQAVARLRSANKNPTSINLTKQAINSIAGTLITDGFNAAYVGEAGIPSAYGDIIHELYVEDRALGGWEKEEIQFERNGLIYRGTMEFFKDYSKSTLGRVGLRLVPPERIIYDADWITDNINDNRFIDTWAYMSAKEIGWTWGDNPKVRAAVEQRIEIDRLGSSDMESPIIPFDNSPEFRDDINRSYLVVNRYWLEQEQIPRLFNAETGRYMDYVPVENRRRMARESSAIGGPLQLLEDTVLIEKVKVVCPALSTSFAFAEGDYVYQLGGYHFVHFNADHIMGHPNTPVDQIGDINRKINMRESAIDSWLGTSATTQRYIETGAATPAETARFKKEGNVDGAIFEFKQGARARQSFGNLTPTPPPSNFERSSDRLVGFLRDGVGPAIAPLSGASKAGDSGDLFGRTVQQAVVSMVFSKGFMKSAIHRMHMMYLGAAKQTYIYPMEINGRDGTGVFYINMPWRPDSIDIGVIDYLNVDVKENPTSLSKRSQTMQDLVSGLQFAKNEQMSNIMFATLATLIPNLPDKTKATVDEAASLLIEISLGMMRQQAGVGAPAPGSDVPGSAPAGAPTAAPAAQPAALAA